MNFRLLNEAIENFIGFNIFCDMDGVLVDLEKGVRQALGSSGKLDRLGIVRGLSRLVTEGVDMQQFFEDLDWTADGEDLWSYLLPYEPTILTGGVKGNSIALGKNAWCRKNLGIGEARIIHEHLKERHAAPNCILIDDWSRNTSNFERFGGVGILHASSGDTIGQLKKAIERRTSATSKKGLNRVQKF